MSLTEGAAMLALDRLELADNVSELDPDHVDALARSIDLRGLVVPLVVRPADDDGRHLLCAGFHRHAALRRLGCAQAPVLVRRDWDEVDEAATRAIENIAREQLDPYQEARAVRGDVRPRSHRGGRGRGARPAGPAGHAGREAVRAERRRRARIRRGSPSRASTR
jgi:hypothetical protein